MKPRSWVMATALCLSVVTAAVGSVPRDAIAGIHSISSASGASLAREAGSGIRATVDAGKLLQEGVSARTPMWMIILIVILLLLIWLIYRTSTGWKPLIGGG